MSSTCNDASNLSLTPTERGVLAYLAREENCCCTKEALANALGRNRKTIDRLVSHLKGEGLVAVKACHGEHGAQLPNVYHVTELGLVLIDKNQDPDN